KSPLPRRSSRAPRYGQAGPSIRRAIDPPPTARAADHSRSNSLPPAREDGSRQSPQNTPPAEDREPRPTSPYTAAQTCRNSAAAFQMAAPARFPECLSATLHRLQPASNRDLENND